MRCESVALSGVTCYALRAGCSPRCAFSTVWRTMCAAFWRLSSFLLKCQPGSLVLCLLNLTWSATPGRCGPPSTPTGWTAAASWPCRLPCTAVDCRLHLRCACATSIKDWKRVLRREKGNAGELELLGLCCGSTSRAVRARTDHSLTLTAAPLGQLHRRGACIR